MPHKLKQIVDAQKTEISVSADGDFGEMKITETPSKILGRCASAIRSPLSRLPVLERDQCVAPPSIEQMRCKHQGVTYVI